MIKSFTEEMNNLVKKINETNTDSWLSPSFSTDEDTRGWDIPFSNIWNAGNKNIPIWHNEFGRNIYCYFIKSEEDMIKHLQDILDKAIIKSVEKDESDKKAALKKEEIERLKTEALSKLSPEEIKALKS